MAMQAPEIIAFYLGWNVTDVSDGKYQRYRNPAVYVCGNDYYCAPSAKQKLPTGSARSRGRRSAPNTVAIFIAAEP
jgi:hypothetical protein